MDRLLTRYDIQVKNENDQMELDLILNSDNRKIIHGTVWNDDLENPRRVPEALVQLFKAGKNYKDDPFDIKPIGCVITDASGEFLVGPFEPETMIIFKITKFWRDDISSNSNYCEASFQISGEYSETTSDGEK